MQSQLELFKRTYFESAKFFKLFHVHITFEHSIAEGILETTCIHLPVGNAAVFKQHQTNLKVAGGTNTTIGPKQFNKIYNAMQTHDCSKNATLGFKIEGIVDECRFPLKCERVQLPHFCYYEYHQKFESLAQLLTHVPHDVLVSHNPSKRRFYTAERNFDISGAFDHNAYEICVFEVQFVKFEADWIQNNSRQFE